MRAAILEGVYKPGEWLRQRRIAEEMGASQMPVREALKELAAEGLVKHIPYRGAGVIRFSPQDVADLYTHRGRLEGLAAKSAAENMAPETLAELYRLHEQMKAKFPSMLWGNYSQTAKQSLPERDVSDLDEHAAILVALEAGDGDEAERLMQQHIVVAGRQLGAALVAELGDES